MIKQYRKKPVVIEAIKLIPDNFAQCVNFIGENVSYYKLSDPGVGLGIKTLEGDMMARVGDYIIKGVNGEFYPCKPDIFEKTYEAVEE